MSIFQPRRLPLALAAMAACMSAQAGLYTSADGKFTLSGFGTLGVAATDNDDVVFNIAGQPGGSRQDPTFDVDSKIAVQGTYKFTPTISSTVQLKSKFDNEGKYTPRVDWAFGKWQATPSLSVRAGRMTAPLFMVSDFREVGYANLQVRPPRDVYGQVFYNAVDGADISYQRPVGDATVTAQFWGGTSKSKFGIVLPDDSTAIADFEIKDQFGLNIVAEFDSGITLRAGHTQGKMTIESPSYPTVVNGANRFAPLLQAVGQTAYAAQFAAVGQVIPVDNVKASFDGIGISVDQDNWVGTAEFTKRKAGSSQVTDSTGWYANVGYRFGKFTPFVGYSKLKVDRKKENPISASALAAVGPSAGAVAAARAAAAGAPPSTQAALAAQASAQASAGATQVSDGVTRILKGQDYGQSTTTIGMRWDAFSSAAIKAQWDRIKPDGANGQFTGVRPGYDGKAVNVLTLSVDFVF